MTTLDQEVDVFLEHFGAKGMKWGVRKSKSTSKSSTTNPHAKRNRNLKIAGGVAAAVIITAGAIHARQMLKGRGTTRAIGQIKRNAIKNRPETPFVKELLGKSGGMVFGGGSNSKGMVFGGGSNSKGMIFRGLQDS